MGNPVAKLIDMVQLIENVLVVNAEYRSGFGLGWKNGQQFQKFAIFGVFIPGNLWRNPSYRVSHFLCKDSYDCNFNSVACASASRSLRFLSVISPSVFPK